MNVRNKTNDDLKEYRVEVLKKGFKLPQLIPIWDDDELTERREDKGYVDLRFDKNQKVTGKSKPENDTSSIIDVKIPIKKNQYKSLQQSQKKKENQHRKSKSLMPKI